MTNTEFWVQPLGQVGCIGQNGSAGIIVWAEYYCPSSSRWPTPPSIDVDDNLDPVVNMGFNPTKSTLWTKWAGAEFTTLASGFVSPSRLSVTLFQRLIAFAGLRRFMALALTDGVTGAPIAARVSKSWRTRAT